MSFKYSSKKHFDKQWFVFFECLNSVQRAARAEVKAFFTSSLQLVASFLKSNKEELNTRCSYVPWNHLKWSEIFLSLFDPPGATAVLPWWLQTLIDKMSCVKNNFHKPKRLHISEITRSEPKICNIMLPATERLLSMVKDNI